MYKFEHIFLNSQKNIQKGLLKQLDFCSKAEKVLLPIQKALSLQKCLECVEIQAWLWPGCGGSPAG